MDNAESQSHCSSALVNTERQWGTHLWTKHCPSLQHGTTPCTAHTSPDSQDVMTNVNDDCIVKMYCQLKLLSQNMPGNNSTSQHMHVVQTISGYSHTILKGLATIECGKGSSNKMWMHGLCTRYCIHCTLRLMVYHSTCIHETHLLSQRKEEALSQGDSYQSAWAHPWCEL